MNNAKTARIVMAVVILFSIAFGSHRSLTAEANKAEAAFFNGVKGDGFGINNDLNIRIEESYNLITVAKRYLNETDPAIQAVLEARKLLAEAETPSEKYKANLSLTEAYTDLSEALQKQNLSAIDENYRKGLITELNSRNDIISHDGYNKLAEEFNAMLKVFPANLLHKLVGVKPLALFR